MRNSSFVELVFILQLRPPVGSPGDGTLDEQGGTILSGAVAVADEDVLVVEGVDGTVTCSLPLFLVTFQEEGAATIGHILTIAIHIGTVDGLAAPYGHAVVRLGTTTAIVPRHKKIIIAAMLEDEGRFDGVRTGKTRCGVGLRGFVVAVITTGNGSRLLPLLKMHR